MLGFDGNVRPESTVKFVALDCSVKEIPSNNIKTS
jgi:hypothetical protein